MKNKTTAEVQDLDKAVAMHPHRKQIFLWRRTGMGMSTFEAIKSQQG
jgi:hypothetical protein